MRIARIIGTVTLNRCHPSFANATLRLTVPLSLANLTDSTSPDSDPIVVYDELGSGLGSQILLSEGAEAAQPFRPDLKPVDAYNAGILDEVRVHLPQEANEQEVTITDDERTQDKTRHLRDRS